MRRVRQRGRFRRAAGTALVASSLLAPVADAQVRTLTSGRLEFVHAPGDRSLAEALAQVAGAFRPPVLPDAWAAGDPPVRIHLASDEAAFDSLTGGRAPDWGAGVAFPGTGVIVLPAYASSRGAEHGLDQILKHELAHIALQRYVAPAQVPHWFSEGYATWAAGQFDESAGWMLRLAFVTGRAPPLDSLTLDWPVGAIDARVAYMLSASAVSWLHGNGGDRVFGIFLERWRASRNFEGALRATYGLTLGQLEEYWAASIKRRYGWLLFLAQSAVIWSLIAFIVLVLVAIRRRRDRTRLAILRASEPPDDPAYWLVPAEREAGDVAEGPPGDATSRPTGDVEADETGRESP